MLLYTQPNVVELCFYHQTHVQRNGEPTYGQQNLKSLTCMSLCVPQNSQFLKDHIWIQLSQRHTITFVTNTQNFGGKMQMSKKP
jgi:hypothetical protein